MLTAQVTTQLLQDHHIPHHTHTSPTPNQITIITIQHPPITIYCLQNQIIIYKATTQKPTTLTKTTIDPTNPQEYPHKLLKLISKYPQ